ncbi:MAG: cellulose biosynthesis cyclic di-GMP-binding regulatory protein BcsB [Plesiomonas sp.]
MTELSKKIMLIALSLIGVTPALVRADSTTYNNLIQAQSTTAQVTLPASEQANIDPLLIPADSTATTTEIAPADAPPVKNEQLTFKQLLPTGELELRNALKTIKFDFGVRSDQMITNANLHLIFTPSPAMIPVMSQLKVYMNDELMQVIPIEQNQMGKEISQAIPLDSKFIKDFNTLKIELIGHYEAACEDPLNNALWVTLSRKSTLDLTVQSLALKNNLAMFPEPFFDQQDINTLNLPFVFQQTPSLTVQKAASTLASWFGIKAAWRGQQFPVLFNQLPESHAIVFATNSNRPDFLKDYPPVDAPTVEMINHPNNPYVKLLLILGRNDEDLLTASQGIALGNTLLRGQSTTINKVDLLVKRKPYDAPNWIRTDRPIPFSELMEYPQQLQVSGMTPSPITLNMNVPPDLFTWRSPGIPLNLQYRYTPPVTTDSSRLNVSINDQFVQAFLLRDSGQGGSSAQIRLPVLTDMLTNDNSVMIPALKIGARNQLRFDFSFSSYFSGGPTGTCVSNITPNVQAAIEPSSTIDFSGYHHYIAMPDLRAFANVGFPFTRMADLSQTLVLMPGKPDNKELALLFSLMGHMGSSTGYPVINVSLTDDWQQAKTADKDLLLIGQLPSDDLLLSKDHSALIKQTQAWISQPMREISDLQLTPSQEPNPSLQAASRVDTQSEGNIAAIVGFESPYSKQRSVVAMMASDASNFELITQSLNDSSKVATMNGSVIVFRDGQLHSERVGEMYYVGQLPWWMLLWYHLSHYPIVLALVAALSVVLVAIALWNTLRWVTRRRLNDDRK